MEENWGGVGENGRGWVRMGGDGGDDETERRGRAKGKGEGHWEQRRGILLSPHHSAAYFSPLHDAPRWTSPPSPLPPLHVSPLDFTPLRIIYPLALPSAAFHSAALPSAALPSAALPSAALRSAALRSAALRSAALRSAALRSAALRWTSPPSPLVSPAPSIPSARDGEERASENFVPPFAPSSSPSALHLSPIPLLPLIPPCPLVQRESAKLVREFAFSASIKRRDCSLKTTINTGIGRFGTPRTVFSPVRYSPAKPAACNGDGETCCSSVLLKSVRPLLENLAKHLPDGQHKPSRVHVPDAPDVKRPGIGRFGGKPAAAVLAPVVVTAAAAAVTPSAVLATVVVPEVAPVAPVASTTPQVPEASVTTAVMPEEASARAADPSEKARWDKLRQEVRAMDCEWAKKLRARAAYLRWAKLDQVTWARDIEAAIEASLPAWIVTGKTVSPSAAATVTPSAVVAPVVVPEASPVAPVAQVSVTTTAMAKEASARVAYLSEKARWDKLRQEVRAMDCEWAKTLRAHAAYLRWAKLDQATWARDIEAAIEASLPAWIVTGKTVCPASAAAATVAESAAPAAPSPAAATTVKLPAATSPVRGASPAPQESRPAVAARCKVGGETVKGKNGCSGKAVSTGVKGGKGSSNAAVSGPCAAAAAVAGSRGAASSVRTAGKASSSHASGVKRREEGGCGEGAAGRATGGRQGGVKAAGGRAVASGVCGREGVKQQAGRREGLVHERQAKPGCSSSREHRRSS
ncbi:unnamed protein product [Closterium sp. Naga37s-1]|nr:unnamed protein product [Closterium sp. Naga37s-1]